MTNELPETDASQEALEKIVAALEPLTDEGREHVFWRLGYKFCRGCWRPFRDDDDRCYCRADD